MKSTESYCCSEISSYNFWKTTFVGEAEILFLVQMKMICLCRPRFGARRLLTEGAGLQLAKCELWLTA